MESMTSIIESCRNVQGCFGVVVTYWQGRSIVQLCQWSVVIRPVIATAPDRTCLLQ